MATEMHPAQSDGPSDRPEFDRWQRAWSHREQLLRVARRRSLTAEDAEDAVHEAMVRAAEHPHLDDERLGAWLTTVTIRLCVDRYRQVSREAEVRTSPRLSTPVPASVEETVCDRAEARWLAARSGELPARQAEAIWLKAEDLDVAQVAKKMGLSYRTVESLLARARRTLRSALAATLGLLLCLCGRGRPVTGGKVQAATVAATAVTLAVAGFVLPHVGGDQRPGPAHPTGPSDSAKDADGRDSDGSKGRSARTGPSPSQGPPGSAPTDGPLPPLLPEVPLPEVPLAPLETLPALPDPDVPTVPLAPPRVSLPSAPSLPAVPSPSVKSPSVRSPETGTNVPDAGTSAPESPAVPTPRSSGSAPELPGDDLVP